MVFHIFSAQTENPEAGSTSNLSSARSLGELELKKRCFR